MQTSTPLPASIEATKEAVKVKEVAFTSDGQKVTVLSDGTMFLHHANGYFEELFPFFD